MTKEVMSALVQIEVNTSLCKSLNTTVQLMRDGQYSEIDLDIFERDISDIIDKLSESTIELLKYVRKCDRYYPEKGKNDES